MTTFCMQKVNSNDVIITNEKASVHIQTVKFYVYATVFKADILTWQSGGTKIFPRKERNSRAASTS